MATHATVPSPHLEGSAADRSTHPTPRADLRAKHEPQQQKNTPQRETVETRACRLWVGGREIAPENFQPLGLGHGILGPNFIPAL